MCSYESCWEVTGEEGGWWRRWLARNGNGKKEVAEEKREFQATSRQPGLNSHLNASEVALAAITADGRLLTRALPATELRSLRQPSMRRISPSLPLLSPPPWPPSLHLSPPARHGEGNAGEERRKALTPVLQPRHGSATHRRTLYSDSNSSSVRGINGKSSDL